MLIGVVEHAYILYIVAWVLVILLPLVIYNYSNKTWLLSSISSRFIELEGLVI